MVLNVRPNMKIKILFVVILIQCLASPLLAGFTFLNKNRLIFGNAGGFEVVSTLNEGVQSAMIQTLSYGEINKRKGIHFIGPDPKGDESTSFLYELTPQTYNPKETVYLKTEKTFNIADGDLDNLIKNDSPLWGDGAASFSLRYSTSVDNAKLVVGNSANNFIGFYYFGNDYEINGYNITASGGSNYDINYSPIRMSTIDRPFYIGLDAETKTPILTLYPKFTNSSKGINEARIGVNTNLLIETITVSGNFGVDGSYTSYGQFGIMEQLIMSGSTNTQNLGDTLEIGCKEFKVQYTDHNAIIFGSTSGISKGSERIPRVNVWLEVSFKHPVTGVFMKTKEKSHSHRYVDGSWAQNSVSLITQLAETFFAKYSSIPNYTDLAANDNLVEGVDWKVCLKTQLDTYSTGKYVLTGDQNQLQIIALPGTSYPSNLEPPVPEDVPDFFEQGNFTIEAPDRPLLQKNAVVLESEEDIKNKKAVAGISAVGEFLMFSDGQRPVTLLADKIKVDDFIQLKTLKVLNEEDEVSENIFQLNSQGTSTGKNRLNFILEENEGQDNTFKGPYGWTIEGENASVDQTTELVNHGIAVNMEDTTTTKLTLKSGLVLGENKTIQFKIKDSNPVIVLDNYEGSSTFVMDNPIADVYYTGQFEGTIGRMFYIQCGSGTDPDVISNVDPHNATRYCKQDNTASGTVMKLTLNQGALGEGNDEVTFELTILSTFAGHPQTNGNTKLVISGLNPEASIDNGSTSCGGTCTSGPSYFSGDRDNSSYSFANLAKVSNVKASQTISIKLNLENFRSDTNDLGDFLENYINTTNEYPPSSGGILVIAFPVKK
jgi:hypothetical protein